MLYNYENLNLYEIALYKDEPCFLHQDLFMYNKNLSLDFLISNLQHEDIIYTAYNKHITPEFFRFYYSLEMLQHLFDVETEYDYDQPYGPYHNLNPRLHLQIRLELVDKFYFINSKDLKNGLMKFDFDLLSHNKFLTKEFIKFYSEENWNRNRIIFFL